MTNEPGDDAAARAFAAMRRATPARLGVGRAGPRYTTAAMLQFRADHARAVDAVMSEVSATWVRRSGLTEVRSQARDREQFLLRPELGRRLAADDERRLARPGAAAGKRQRAKSPPRPSVLICVGDGLSSAAVERNAAPLARALAQRLCRGFRLLPPLFIRNARVRIEDHLGELLRPDVVVMLIGERPGLATAESLSAYIIWRPTLKSLEPERTVISNIHRGGIRIADASRKIAAVVADAVRHRATGAALARDTAAPD